MEIFQTYDAQTRDYNNLHRLVFELGSLFRNSLEINVIDSWTSGYWENRPTTPATKVAKRYKGDPFSDDDTLRPGYKVWHDIEDVGATNCWIIIECQSSKYPLLPKWQAKLQWHNGYSGFADVSDPTGVTYPKHHNNGWAAWWRFSPLGGWNLLDVAPDFTPATLAPNPTTENHFANMGPSHSGFVIGVDNGQFYILNLRKAMPGSKETIGFGYFYSLSCYFGDVDPVDINYMPIPRIQICQGNTTFEIFGRGSSHVLCDGNTDSSGGNDYAVNDNGGGGMTFWDHNLVRYTKGYRIPSFYNLLLDGLTQPNQYASELEVDLFPYMPMPRDQYGLRFSIPMFRYGWGVGRHPVNNMGWLSTCPSDYCLYTKWDGSTVLI